MLHHGESSPWTSRTGGRNCDPPSGMLYAGGFPACYFLVISVKIGTLKTSNFTFVTFSE
jgi:hypothetical protein